MTTTEKINPEIFKANDIRGKYPSEINEKAVSEIAKKLSVFFHSGKIIIAHDTRLSSSSLYKAVVKNLKIGNYKLEIVPAGPATTPMFYFLVKKFKAAGGIMITASHNPKEYNGLKIVGKNALPISGKEVSRIIQKSKIKM